MIIELCLMTATEKQLATDGNNAKAKFQQVGIKFMTWIGAKILFLRPFKITLKIYTFGEMDEQSLMALVLQ